MKLMHDLIIRRLDVSKDFDLNNENSKSIWTFYEVYKLCVNFLGITDNQLKRKQKLILSLIINPDNIVLLNKLKTYISEDNKVVELTLNSLKESEDIDEIYEDFYPVNIIGVNLDDRGN
ncbi:MAG: hypothetical protein KKB88_05340 [Nanoarchaeota archaeon]|nr:hypothetical protein [Nanoarchaeota archaeon]